MSNETDGEDPTIVHRDETSSWSQEEWDWMTEQIRSTGTRPQMFIMSSSLAHEWKRWTYYTEQLKVMIEKLPWWSLTRWHANALYKRTMGQDLRGRVRGRYRRWKWNREDDDGEDW